MTDIDEAFPTIAVAAGEAAAEPRDEGYAHSLKPRQVRMMAIGGAIGTGLFLGAGARLQLAGPALALVYLVCGAFVFLILRALGELVMYRPTSGSFVSYAREFFGERASFVAGWMYYVNWAMTGIVDITAVALYMRFWGTFADVPQWVFALGALGIVGGINMMAVKWFGELEFWFSLIKVAALVLFLLIGATLLSLGHHIAGTVPGAHLVAANGGVFPHGLLPAVVIIQGVVFAYSGVEILGVAAGEAQDARRVLPGAINGVMWRIGLFYVGSVVLLVLLLPWTAYKAGVSPFVTFFGALGVPGIGTAMNIVVLTAALSSLNSGLYSTGRVLRSLAMGGSAPPFVARMNASQVPYGGILVTLAVYLVGVGLNYLVPSQVFEIVLNIAALGIVSTWAFIVACQMRLRAAQNRGEIERIGFRLPLAPVTSWSTLGFLALVIVLMAFDYPDGTYTVAAIPVVAIALALGWKALKRSPSARLATYGTLAPGRANHHQLGSLAGEWRPGTVRGKLFSEGWGAAQGYPGLVLDPSGDEVEVQVFTSADLPHHWARLDDFEGEGYRRVHTRVATASGEFSAYIYVLTVRDPAPSPQA